MTESIARRLNQAITAAGGTVSGQVTARSQLPRLPDAPFARANLIEHDVVRAVEVGASTAPPHGASFLDGVQRYSVVGHIGLIPIVRGWVGAAVLARHDGDLAAQCLLEEEFLAVPLHRLTDVESRRLAEVGLPLHDSQAGERSHPQVDLYCAARVVEARREAVELGVARRHLSEFSSDWLVVDGSLSRYDWIDQSARVLGVIKSHETQFLRGGDLATALTLPEGYRTSVFSRAAGGHRPVYTWYLRLRPAAGHDLLHGLVRLERPAGSQVVAESSAVSRWIMSERAPLAAPDERWDRLLYPIRQVEEYLRARAGGLM